MGVAFSGTDYYIYFGRIQELIGAQFLHVVHQDDAIKVADAVRSALLYKEVVQVT